MKRAMKSSVIALLAFVFSFYLSYGAENVPQTIRIGLTFNNPSIESIVVASSEGFEFGLVNGDSYENLCPYIDFKELKIEKASDFNESVFLVKAGSVSDDLQSLSDDIEMLEDMDEVFFTIYDDGWSLCAGPYSSRSEAESKAKSFSNKTDKIVFNVNEYDSLILVEAEGGRVLAYEAMKNEYLIKPFSGKNEDSVFSYKGHQYRGGVMIKRYSGSDLTVINYLDMNEYLYGVLPWEMSNSWPLEALKAQAVAARNFAISNYGKYSHLGFNLCNTQNSQAYVGYDYEGASCNRAVDETYGEILRWNGQIVSAFYHTNSGGYTENSENVWSMEVPYLKGVEDVFSIGESHYSWEIEYSEDSIYNIMRSAGYDVGKSIDMSIARRSENNHVLELLIESDKADVTLLKNTMRTIFGYDMLKSTLFDIRKDNDLYCINKGLSIQRIPAKGISVLSGDGKISKTDFENCHVLGGSGEKENSGANGFVIEGRGWGHGLGMSQEGAKAMAEEGYGYKDILSFYYTDTTIE